MTVPVRAVTFVHAGTRMDIFDQVNEILEKAETEETLSLNDRRLLETSVIRDLSIRYRQLMKSGQRELADDCLTAISRMIVVLLAE